MKKIFDVAIVGGGVSGCASFYVLNRYSDVSSVAIVEKCDRLAKISSNLKANSQTLHSGDIETNYTFEKASKVRFSAIKVMNYALNRKLQNKAIFKHQKIVIGVGEKECEFIKKRGKEFKKIFPELELFDRDKIGRAHV